MILKSWQANSPFKFSISKIFFLYKELIYFDGSDFKSFGADS